VDIALNERSLARAEFADDEYLQQVFNNLVVCVTRLCLFHQLQTNEGISSVAKVTRTLSQKRSDLPRFAPLFDPAVWILNMEWLSGLPETVKDAILREAAANHPDVADAIRKAANHPIEIPELHQWLDGTQPIDSITVRRNFLEHEKYNFFLSFSTVNGIS